MAVAISNVETPATCIQCGVELPGGKVNDFCPECLAWMAWNSALHRLRDECLRTGRRAQFEATKAVVAGVDLGWISADLVRWYEIDHGRADMGERRLRMRLVELWIEELTEKLKPVADDVL